MIACRFLPAVLRGGGRPRRPPGFRVPAVPMPEAVVAAGQT
jgi:hypothetical protein